MKPINNLAYIKAVLLGFLTELTLISIQFAYLNIAADNSSGSEFNLTYMKAAGFYIFQVIGFFLYTIVIYIVAKRMTNQIFKKVLAILITGGIMELSFYIFMVGEYEGAFLYSILDKVIAATFGMIIVSYTTKESKRPESYF